MGLKEFCQALNLGMNWAISQKTGRKSGTEKVERVSEHVNMIMRYIPYIQANFVLGLDSEEGDEPYELTKRFVDKAPGAFPGYSLLSAFGRAAPLNLSYQHNNRVLPVPFHFLDNNQAMNVKPLNYSWTEFYDHVIDLVGYTYSKKAIYRRFRANRTFIPKWMNVVRAISSEGHGRWKYHKAFRKRLIEDRPFRSFMEGETQTIPDYFIERIKKELGADWEWLPKGAISHDQNAYIKSEAKKKAVSEDLVEN